MVWGAWKQGPRTSPKHKAERDNTHASDLLTSARMLVYLRSSTNWEPSVQYLRFWGIFLIKTITIGLLVFSIMVLFFSSSFPKTTKKVLNICVPFLIRIIKLVIKHNLEV